jgi:hypothetical protein
MGIIGVQLEASKYGFRLADMERDGELLWGWRRGSDQDWPLFRTEREAADWMEHQLRRGSIPEPR